MKKIVSMLMVLAMLFASAALAEDYIVAISEISGGFVGIMSANETYGVADTTGRITVPCVYEEVGSINDGIALVVQNGLYGYVNAATGETVVPCEYQYAQPFSEGIGVVQVNNELYRCYNSKGEVLFEKDFEIKGFSEGMAQVYAGTNFTLPWRNAFMDKNGEIALTFTTEEVRDMGGKSFTAYVDKYLRMEGFCDGMAVAVSETGDRQYLYGYVNQQGEEVVPPKYDFAGSFSEGMGLVCTGDLYGFVNAGGAEIVPPKYLRAANFSDGMAMVMDESQKIGYINDQGVEVIPCQYSGGTSFGGGLAGVAVDGKIGFIDKTGAVVIEPQFENCYNFKREVCPVKLNGKWGVIHASGTLIVPIEYDCTRVSENGEILGLKDGQIFTF